MIFDDDDGVDGGDPVEKLERIKPLYEYILGKGEFCWINSSFDLMVGETHGGVNITKRLEPTQEAVDAWLRSRGVAV